MVDARRLPKTRYLCPIFKCYSQTSLLSTIPNLDTSRFQIPTVPDLSVIQMYSNHLNTGLVWYSNGQKLSGLQMVRYSNG